MSSVNFTPYTIISASALNTAFSTLNANIASITTSITNTVTTWAPQLHQGSGGTATGHQLLWADQNIHIQNDGMWILCQDQSLYTQIAITGTPTTGESPGVVWTVNSTVFHINYTVQPSDTTNQAVALGLANAISSNTGLTTALVNFKGADGIGYTPFQTGYANQTGNGKIVLDQPWAASGNSLVANSSAHSTVTITSALNTALAPKLDGNPILTLTRYVNGYQPTNGDQAAIIYFQGQKTTTGLTQIGAISMLYTGNGVTTYGTQMLFNACDDSGTSQNVVAIGKGLYMYNGSGSPVLGDMGVGSISANAVYANNFIGNGAFTTLSASSTVAGTGFSNYLASPPAIGGTTANTGAFTTLSTTGQITVNNGSAALIELIGGGATPNKYLRSYNGSFGIINSAYTTAILTLTDGGNLFTEGGIDNTAIGANTPSSGAFTSLSATGGITFSGGTNGVGSIYTDTNWGCLIRGRSGVDADVALQSSTGNVGVVVSASGVVTLPYGAISLAILPTGDSTSNLATTAFVQSTNSLSQKNILNYGVVHDPAGTHIANNTAAYQAILNSASSYYVVHPEGVTVYHTGLTIPQSMTYELNGLLVLAPTSNVQTVNCCVLINASNVAVKVGATGVIDGNRANQLGTYTANLMGGIVSTQNITYAPATYLSDIYVSGSGLITNVVNWPVSIYSTNRTKITGLRMTNSGNAPQFAQGCVNFEFANNYVSNIPDYGYAAYQGCSFGTCHDNIFSNTAVVGVLNDGTGSTGYNQYPCHHIQFFNNIIENSTTWGFGVYNASYIGNAANHYAIDVYDNQILNFAWNNPSNPDGFFLKNCHNITIKRNLISGGGYTGTNYAGIDTSQGNVSYVVVEDNIIENLGQVGSGFGITVGADHLVCRNNIIRDTQANATMQYGLSGTCGSNTVLTNNYINNMVTSATGLLTLAADTVYLDGGNDNFAKPRPIGNTTPNTGAFTTLSATGAVTASGGITFSGGTNGVGSIYTDTNWGCLIRGRSGGNADVALQSSTGNVGVEVSASGLATLPYGAISLAILPTGDNTTNVATTAFVHSTAANYLPLAGGTLTGALVATTATFTGVTVSGTTSLGTVTSSASLPTNDNTSNVATTAFVRSSSPFQNVLAYGADPTGVNNSTTAFQNAMAKGPIIIPAYQSNGAIAVYAISNCVVPNGCTILGMSSPAYNGTVSDPQTILGPQIVPYSTATQLFNINNRQNIKFEGVYINCFNGSQASIANGITGGGSCITIRDCAFMGCNYGLGGHVNGSTATFPYGSWVLNMYNTVFEGCLVGSSDITDGFVFGGSFTACGDGIRGNVQNSGPCSFVGTRFEECGSAANGLYLGFNGYGANTNGDGLTFSSCTFDANGNAAVYLRSATKVSFNGCVFTRNGNTKASGTTLIANSCNILVSGVTGLTMTGCTGGISTAGNYNGVYSPAAIISYVGTGSNNGGISLIGNDFSDYQGSTAGASLLGPKSNATTWFTGTAPTGTGINGYVVKGNIGTGSAANDVDTR